MNGPEKSDVKDTGKTALKLLTVSLSAMFSLALILSLIKENSLDEVDQISQFDGPLLTLYMLLSSLALGLRALRYRTILQCSQSKLLGSQSKLLGSRPRLLATNAEKIPNFTVILLITAIRNALVDALPARAGELSFIGLLHREGVTLGRSSAAFGLTLILDLYVLVAIAAFSLTIQTSPLFAFTLSLAILLLGRLIMHISCGIAIKGLWQLRHKFRLRHFLLATISIKHQLHFKSHTSNILLLQTVLLRLGKYSALVALLYASCPAFAIAPPPLSQIPAATMLFILAEGVASLPASGFLGFGAYELSWHETTRLTGVMQTDIGQIFLIHAITQTWGYSLALLAFTLLVLRKKKQKTR
ncbi:MAG: lysylphosphatidylglycerol synthase domain-containing protein [bacterium]|nr:lysylphosphatidylglycerol synthase domain-containing protein [bacterium]